METTTFGLMAIESQEFMGFKENEAGSDTLSMFSPRRFETENIKEIVDFMCARPDRNGTYSGNDYYDPSEFVPVAFLRKTSAFSEAIDIKAVNLPDIISIRSYATRSWANMPENLRRIYVPAEKREPILGKNVEFLLVDVSDGEAINEGDIVYGGRYSTQLGQVVLYLPVPEDWPTNHTTIPDENLRLLLVHSENAALKERLTYSDIEPKAAAPKI